MVAENLRLKHESHSSSLVTVSGGGNELKSLDHSALMQSSIQQITWND